MMDKKEQDHVKECSGIALEQSSKMATAKKKEEEFVAILAAKEAYHENALEDMESTSGKGLGLCNRGSSR